MKSCSNPGCDQPGTSSCSACKTTAYCCVICQTADWAHHKEECQGHLRKVGMANLVKARGFHGSNWVQALHYAELAASKLKQLKDRRLETVQVIGEALAHKYDALQRMGRYRKAMECAEERYTLWAMNQMRNPGSIKAALGLIQSCIHNEEYEDAEHYARHAMFMINDMTDNFIPSEMRPHFLAEGSYFLATAIYHLAAAGGISPEEKQKAGEEAIALAREALKIHTQLHGAVSAQVACDMGTLAHMLYFFKYINGDDEGIKDVVDCDDEVLRLHQQSIAVYRRVEGRSSFNVAAGEGNLGNVYKSRAARVHAANDLDRCMANLELALPHYSEAVRIYRANNHVDDADKNQRTVTEIEEMIQQIGTARAAAAAGTATMG